MRVKIVPILVTIVCVFALSINISPTVAAATITVNTLADEYDGSCSDGDCSLRDAIQVANPGDTIDFSVNGNILLVSELYINKQLIISGPGWDHLSISGNQKTRVFNVGSSGDLSLRYVMITGGNGEGAGLYNLGTVNAIGDVFVYNNNPAGGGGAIYNNGTLTVLSTAISDNSASGNGGGINNENVLYADRSTFYHNEAAWGGGIKNEHGVATVTNCTFYENTASMRGAGIDSGSSSILSVVNSTFFENKGNTGLGNPSSTTTVINTIVASNENGDCSGSDFTIQSNHNLSTDDLCVPGFTLVSANDLKLTWGGFPVLIGLNSIAIDAGTNEGCPAIDQMGTPRPQDGDLNGTAVCDVGSDEIQVFGIFVPVVMR